MSAQYSNLAAFYDLLNDSVDYDEWLEFILGALERDGFKPASVLDLACGTGQMALRLAQKGFETIAVDLSAEMLSLAKQKADKEKLDILFLNQDMSEFELYGTVDLVVCCLDSINYLTSPSKVVSCFSAVNNYLNPGGYFVFDINSEYKFKHVYADNAYVFESDKVFCTWQNYYNPTSRICDFYLDFFVEQNGVYKRYGETQRERCYTLRQMLSYLKKSGLELKGVYTDFSFTPADEKNQENAERFYIICQKM